MRAVMAALALVSWALVIALALLGHPTVWWAWTAGAITALVLITCLALEPDSSDRPTTARH